MKAINFAVALPALVAATFEVPTFNGLIVGHAASKTSDVIEWLGIPFAQPPVGNLRFAPPQAYGGFGIHVASNYVR